MRYLRYILVSSFLLYAFAGLSQIKLGNNLDSRNATSLMEMESDSLVFVPPRMTTSDRNAISGPLTGAVIYNTQDSCLQTYDGSNWNCVSANKRLDWFYAPSLTIDASATSTNDTLDLYTEYETQFGSPMYTSVSAPPSIPIYQATDFHYYVTYYDNTVMNIDFLTDSGILQYDITNVPDNDYTQINVVFVLKSP